MKIYQRILDTARANGYMPKDTRGHWDFGVKGHMVSAAELRQKHKDNQAKTKAKTAARSAATRSAATREKSKAKKAAKVKVSEVVVAKKEVCVETALNKKWKADRQLGDNNRDTHKQYESVGNGV